MLIYIAGPYTKGDVAVNVRKAIEVGDKVWAMGHTPFVPHLTHFWHFVSPKSWHEWLELDRVVLRRCDAVFRIPGVSIGADEEVREALLHHIPVYYNFKEIP